MSLLRSRRRPPVEERASIYGPVVWNQAGVPGLIADTLYGTRPQTAQAVRNAASLACIDVLADSISRTPLAALRAGAGGALLPMPQQPPLILDPSGLVTDDVWRYQLAYSLVTDGNAFGHIVQWDRLGYPAQVELADPTTVTARKVIDGVAHVKVDNQPRTLYPHGDIFFVPGRYVPAGTCFALSPVDLANISIGTSLAAEQFSRDYFQSGAHPSAILTSQATNLTPEEARAIKESARNAMSGRDLAVMGADLTYTPIQTNVKDSQPVEVIQFEIEQTCRFWKVPPAMVYAAVSGKSVTYANASQADLHYLKHSLEGYLIRIEKAMTRALPRPQWAQFDRNAILRTDVEGRFIHYQLGLANDVYSVNWVRAQENLPPWPDKEYDKPGLPTPPGQPQPVPSPLVPNA